MLQVPEFKSQVFEVGKPWGYLHPGGLKQGDRHVMHEGEVWSVRQIANPVLIQKKREKKRVFESVVHRIYLPRVMPNCSRKMRKPQPTFHQHEVMIVTTASLVEHMMGHLRHLLDGEDGCSAGLLRVLRKAKGGMLDLSLIHISEPTRPY